MNNHIRHTKEDQGAEPGGRAPRGTFVVRTLQQARVLSDPLRLRILQGFVDRPRTTKQVADLLGENPPKLYRHVEALREAGFLEPKGERQKRGTVERYLQAVAARFEMDPSLFDVGGSDDTGGVGEVLHTLVQSTESEMRAALARVTGPNDPLHPIMAQIRGRLSRQRFVRLRRELLALVEECQGAGGEGEDSQAFGGMIALYPLASDEDSPNGT
jgi:DNA-binding transcriptional ArsR family regulator